MLGSKLLTTDDTGVFVFPPSLHASLVIPDRDRRIVERACHGQKIHT